MNNPTNGYVSRKLAGIGVALLAASAIQVAVPTLKRFVEGIVHVSMARFLQKT
jgi:hypothetical protein